MEKIGFEIRNSMNRYTFVLHITDLLLSKKYQRRRLGEKDTYKRKRHTDGK
jgi:hypothetical protein